MVWLEEEEEESGQGGSPDLDEAWDNRDLWGEEL